MKIKRIASSVLAALMVTTAVAQGTMVNALSTGYTDDSVAVKYSAPANNVFDQALSIKYFQADANGEPIKNTVTDVEIPTITNNLQDGIYFVDKGYGWVRSEEDFLQDAYGSDTDEISIMSSHTSSSTHSTSIGVGVGIKTEIIEATLTATYSHEWTNSSTISVGYEIEAEADKQLYAKIYSTSRRWDIISIKNGEVKGLTSSYAPSGTWAKTISYNKGEQIDKSVLTENTPRRVTDSVNSSRATQETVISYDGLTDAKVFQGDDLQSIQNIQRIDEENGEYTVSDVLTRGDFSSFRNGYYTIDYGNHWVKPNDSGVIHTFVIPQNASGVYEQSVTSGTTHSTDFSFSVKVTIPLSVVSVALDTSYGYSWSSEMTESVDVEIPAKDGYNVFAKIQTVNHRIDVIRVQGGQIIARETSYIPTGFMNEKIYYKENSSADQSQLYANEAYCIFGEEEPDVDLINHCVMLYDLKGGYGPYGTDFSPQYVLPNTYAKEPAAEPKRFGYTFKGWYVDPTYRIPMRFDNWLIIQDCTIFAKWVENPKYTLSFNLNGGSGNFAPQVIYKGESPTLPTAIPTKEGYVFDGWYVDSRLTNPMNFDSWKMNHSGSVFAKWRTPREFTITFDANGGTGSYPSVKVAEGGRIAQPATPTKEGYKFVGWQTYSGNPVNFETYNFYGSTKLIAQWTDKNYTLNFNLNGGTGIFPAQYYNHGENPVKPAGEPTKEGYTFEGWFIDSRLTKPMVFENWTMTHSGSVFAKWSKDTYTVNFVGTFGEDLQIENQYVTSSDRIIKPADPVKEGFVFVGWYAYAGASRQIDFNTFRVSSDQTIYARWANA